MGLALATGPAAADPCAPQIEALRAALQAQAAPRLLDALAQARRAAVCPEAWLNAYAAKATLLLAQQAGERIEAGRLAEAGRLLDRAPASVWQLHATRGDLAAAQAKTQPDGARRARWKEAAGQYGLAYELATDPQAGDLARPGEQERLFRYTTEALAQVGSLETAVSRSGAGSGILGSRGFKPEYVPLPIRFAFNQATLTQEGEGAVAQLADYLRTQRPRRVELVGHTDPVGGTAANQALSEARAATVKDRLLALLGDAAPPQIIGQGVGEGCPPVVSDPGRYSPRELCRLYRRVELKLDQGGSAPFRRCGPAGQLRDTHACRD